MKIRSAISRAAIVATLGATVLSGVPTVAAADTSDELQAKLDEANSRLSSLYSEAEQASDEVNQTQEQLDATNAEIETKQSELAEAQDTLASRVSSNYKTGGVSLFSIIFDSSTFEELVSHIIYANKVSDSDAQAISEVKQIQDELSSKQAEQQQLLASQQQQQEELQQKVSEAQSYVSSLDQQVQEALAAEQAAREAEAEAARQQAEQQAQANDGIYVTPDANSNTNTNSNSNSNSSSNSNNSSNGGSSSNSSARNAIVAAAWSKVGCSYVYGATGPSSYDCSGFVQYCYSQAGISLPRTSGAQGSCGTTTSNPQAGDIVCYGGHVGIYIGGGMMIDAGNPSVGVSYRAVYGSPWYQSVV